MDPITAALVTALSAGAMSALTETSKTAITDAYARLKALLARKFGAKSDVVQAVDALETKPDSAGRRATLQEEITSVQADKDEDLLQVAQALMQVLQAPAEGGPHSQTAIGSYIAQADRGGNATVNIGRLPEH